MKMSDWFLFAMLAMVFWGLGDFFPKLAVNYINPKSAVVYGAAGGMIVGLIFWAFVGFHVDFNIKGMTFGLLTGIAGTLGYLFFLYAVNRGKVSVIVSAAALYPIVTIALAFLILKEPVSVKQGIGMFLALVAMLLLAG